MNAYFTQEEIDGILKDEHSFTIGRVVDKKQNIDKHILGVVTYKTNEVWYYVTIDGKAPAHFQNIEEAIEHFNGDDAPVLLQG